MDNNNNPVRRDRALLSCPHESEVGLVCRLYNTSLDGQCHGEMETVSRDMAESDPRFRTWEELEDIPAIDSTVRWYERFKQACSVTEAGLSALEWGIQSLADILQIKRLAGEKSFSLPYHTFFTSKVIKCFFSSYPQFC